MQANLAELETLLRIFWFAICQFDSVVDKVRAILYLLSI